MDVNCEALCNCYFVDFWKSSKGGDSEVSSSKCPFLNFLNIMFEKKHTLNPEITLLYQFHAQKALLKGPKICNKTFLIENAPPPLELL